VKKILMCLLLIVTSGCALTADDIRNKYEVGQLHKALVVGKNTNQSGTPYVVASWGKTTKKDAIDEALKLCRRNAYNCELVNVDGSTAENDPDFTVTGKIKNNYNDNKIEINTNQASNTGPKTSQEAFAQCEEYNKTSPVYFDCRNDYLYKKMLETEKLKAIEARERDPRPMPKTSQEAFAQCEEYNKSHGTNDDCHNDFVYKSMVESESRKAAEALERKKKQAAESRERDAKARAIADAKAQAAKPGVKIGMTQKDVLENTSWGKPLSINRTTTAIGTREQWVYVGNNYLYFTNGILTAIQN